MEPIPEQAHQDEDPLLVELKAIACGDVHFVGTLQIVEIAFTPIPNLVSLKNVYNLIELSLLHTQISSLSGIEAVSHSLARLTVLSGCRFDTSQ